MDARQAPPFICRSPININFSLYLSQNHTPVAVNDAYVQFHCMRTNVGQKDRLIIVRANHYNGVRFREGRML
jgi:hypothetical protein